MTFFLGFVKENCLAGCDGLSALKIFFLLNIQLFKNDPHIQMLNWLLKPATDGVTKF